MAHKIRETDLGLSMKSFTTKAAAGLGVANREDDDHQRLADTADKLVCRATNKFGEMDWNNTARIVDFIKYAGGGPGINQVLKAFKRRWRLGSPLVQAKVLGGLDFCMTYVGRAFGARLAGAELWRELKDSAKFRNLVKPSVYELLIVYIRSWATNRGAVTAFPEFFAKLKQRGYMFPKHDSYELLRPPKYIPLKMRTDDAVKVEMLSKAEQDIDKDDNMSVADTAEDAVIEEMPEGQDDGIVVRMPSADLFNLLDLDWDDDQPASDNAAGSGVDPFAASAAPAAAPAAAAGNPFGDQPAAFAAPHAQPQGVAASGAAIGNPFEEAPAAPQGAIPASAIPAQGQELKNPFGNPYTGGPGAAAAQQQQPFAATAVAPHTPGTVPSAFFGAPMQQPVQGMMPVATSGQSFAPGGPQSAWAVFGAAPPAAAQGWGVQPGMMPSDISFSMPRPAMGGFPGTQPLQPPQQQQQVGQVLASIPPPRKDPLDDLMR